MDKNNSRHQYTAIDTPAMARSIEAFYAHLKSLKYSPATIASYKNALRKLVFFLTAQKIQSFKDVTEHDLDALRLSLADQGLASKTMHTYQLNIRRFYTFLEKTHQVFSNPAKGWLLAKVRPSRGPVPTVGDMKKLLSGPDISTPAGIRDRALLEVMYSTGVRLEELTRINAFDVHIKQGVIKVLGKGRKERMVPLGKKARFWLDRYLKDVRPKLVKNRPDEHALFVGAHLKKRINSQIVACLVGDYAKKAQIGPVSPHAIRRACATHMLQGGAHPVQIQLLLGHGSLSVLSRYLHISVKDMLATYKKGKPGR